MKEKIKFSLMFSPWLTRKQLALSFLFSVFFVGLRYSYESSIRIHFDYLVFFIFAALISANLIRQPNSFIRAQRTEFFISTVLVIMIFVSFSIQLYTGLFELEAILWVAKYSLLLYIVHWIARSLSLSFLVLAFVQVSKLSIPFVFLSYVLGRMGIVAGADIWSDGTIRPHGFYSEPSNLCWALPFLCFYTWQQRSYGWFAASLLTMAVAQSPTILVVSTISFLGYWTFRPAHRGFYPLFGAMALALIYISWELFSSDIISAQTGVVQIDRLILGISAIGKASGGGNARWDLLLQWWNFVATNKWILLFGLGPGASNAYVEKITGGMTLDTNIVSAVINSSGIPVLFFIILSTIRALLSRSLPQAPRVLLLCLASSSLVNVSGIFWQATFLLFLMACCYQDRLSRITQPALSAERKNFALLRRPRNLTRKALKDPGPSNFQFYQNQGHSPRSP